ncbi:MAG: glycosyltransferase family 4 protein [Calditrichaceae bacterium]|nr:glycosyltransferase family 4 protein [Calditrichaceae bacterium]MBN2708170.1 glycosyltransferase family 4 protein [Calditrichaceae bacterium]
MYALSSVADPDDSTFKKIKGWFPVKSNPYISVLFSTLSIIKNKPDIIIHEMSLSNLNCYFLPFLSKLLNIKFVFWGHGYHKSDKSGKKNKIRRIVRIFLHKLANANLVYSRGGAEFLIQHGIDKKKVFIAWNALDTTNLNKEKSYSIQLNSDGLVLLFLGRLIPDKYPMIAVEVFKALQAKYNTIALHIIGSGPEERKIKTYINDHSLKKVFLHGEIIYNTELSHIMHKCDILINPGYLGLNIIHALAFGIPVISVNDGVKGIFHSPEFEYIDNTPAFFGSESLDIESFVKICSKFIEECSVLEQAKIAANEILKNISMDSMLKGFQDIVNFVKPDI